MLATYAAPVPDVPGSLRIRRPQVATTPASLKGPRRFLQLSLAIDRVVKDRGGDAKSTDAIGRGDPPLQASTLRPIPYIVLVQMPEDARRSEPHPSQSVVPS